MSSVPFALPACPFPSKNNANPCRRLTRFLITSLMENQELFRLPVFKTAFYDQSALCLMHPCEVSNGSILSQKNTAIFNARSADYGPKLRCCPERTFVEMGRSEGWSHQVSFELFDPCDTVCRFLARRTLHLGDNTRCLAEDNFLKLPCRPVGTKDNEN